MRTRCASFGLAALLVGGCFSDSDDNNPTPLPIINADAAGQADATPSGDGGPAEDGSASTDGQQPSQPDGSLPTQESDILPPGSAATWAKRSCELTLTFRPQVAATNVSLVGDFTGWAKGPLPMQAKGDGSYELMIAPSSQLTPGSLHAYKVIVNGNWELDGTAPYRKFDGDCLNSAFRMPDCEARPELRPTKVEVTAAGTATTRIQVLTAADAAPIAKVRASLDRSALAQQAVQFDAASGTFSVTLGGLDKGKHVLRVRATDDKGRDALPIELPIWIQDEPFDWRDGLLYTFMIDRFADGDKAGNRPVGSPVKPPADWHGGDLVGATRVLKTGYFENLGVRTIWLSPVNTQVDGHFKGRDDDNEYASYHGYWPIRARDVEPRFGGNSALRDFVAEAHRRGLRVVIDLINNQVHDQHEYVAPHPDWFRKSCVCGIDKGCGWSERPFDCNFTTYLPDINWRVPAAEDQFIDDALFWISEFDLDGFRVDAVKHVEATSIYNLRAALAQRFEQGGERIFMVGETAVGAYDKGTFFCQEFKNGYEWIESYTGRNGLDGQFDFPTHHGIRDALLLPPYSKPGDPLASNTYFNKVEEMIASAEAKYKADSLHVRFLGSQDTNRIASIAGRDQARDAKWGTLPPSEYTDAPTYARLKRAFTVLYTMPGIPFLYYGDEIATPGGGDPDDRRDMIWSGELADLTMIAPGASAAPVLSDARNELRAWAQALGKARKDYVALRRGKRIPLIAKESHYVYAYKGAGSKDLALVVVNAEPVALSGLVAPPLPDVGEVTKFKAVAGQGTVTLSGKAPVISIAAGESALFVGE